jgi:hypothetical protein
LGKATILTPLYISVAWVFITTYQLFTQTTVITVTAQIQTYLPTIGTRAQKRTSSKKRKKHKKTNMYMHHK